jgi:hypothetical protein
MNGITSGYAGSFHIPSQTQTAGTAIVAAIPAFGDTYRTRLTHIRYASAATAHTLIVMKALARTYATAAVAITGTSLVLDSITFLNKTLAANDYIVYKDVAGTYRATTVSSIVTATKTLTIPAAAEAIADNAPVWLFGLSSETPNANTNILTVASVVGDYNMSGGGIQAGFKSLVISGTTYQGRGGHGDPMILYSGNGTNAGTLYTASGHFSKV